MTTLIIFQFPESHKIIFCWDVDVRPKSEIHPISVSRILNFQPHKIWSDCSKSNSQQNALVHSHDTNVLIQDGEKYVGE